MNKLPPLPPESIGENKSWRNWLTTLRQNITSAYLKPIDNSKATTDLTLDVGQKAFITATAATSIPLHVACADGQIYEMEMVGTYTQAAAANAAILEPNNTAYPSSFQHMQSIGPSGGSTANELVSSVDSGFRLSGIGSSIFSGTFKIFTSTLYKKLIANAFAWTTTNAYISFEHVLWQDTTTPYTSVGTLILPNAWSGTITLTRVQ